ncbi:nitroreductase family protein [Paenibacillus flagellatus]|uniref:Nitroreductase family protein n=1 Tax=Paenibacillus flagellatus TaxID=2211139 RepID=A0A2V5K9R3_9BACL|nr:nitroreductase family protein [Paenibacillus flagellatus]PYI56295.1 nitroreductase family protein [Paenibacillus flagellatus]
MNDFTALVKSRRSASKFIPGVELSDKELDELFSLVKFAPSAFNLQHARYLVIRDPERKELVYEAANKQYKVRSASAAIVVLGDTLAYRDVGRLNEGFLHLGVIDKLEYDMTVESTTAFYESRGERFLRDEAIRNASLSAMLFMLAAKDRGWDTCPMIGFDPGALRAALDIPDTLEPVMLITIGKEDLSSQRPRGYRKPTGEFVDYETLQPAAANSESASPMV